MERSVRILSFVAALTVLFATAARGQKLETIAPPVVEAGKPFNVEYRIAAQPQRIIPPAFDNFTLIGNGSSTSRSGLEIMTGYTFVLIARQAGNFTIPGASVIVDGETYSSEPKPIEVVGQGAVVPPGHEGQPGGVGQAASGSGEDLFLRAIPDKMTVYRGEPVRVRFKLYSQVRSGLIQNGLKLPSFAGFWQQGLDVSHYQRQTESYNNKVYNTFIVAEYLLYPTQSGILTIDQMTMDLAVQDVRHQPNRSIIDDLMGGFPDVVEIPRPTSSRPVSITVKELPADAPAGFNGAVGNFSMTSDVNQEAMPVNSAATYKIRITGTGNIPLIQAPKMEMPASFEVHNSKMSEDTRLTQAGIAGSRTFEYPFIARAEGDHRIEPVPFSFFNPQTGEYVTLMTREVNMAVVADTTERASSPIAIVGGLSREDLKILGQDIRFIRHDAPNLKRSGSVFMFSVSYFTIAGLLVAAFFFLLFFLQRRIEQMRDEALMKGKKANKVVLARLRVADEFMKEGNRRRFHDEMLKALWGYLSDKLNIPVANLTKENVRESLLRRDIPAEQINSYIDLISECEYAQYSPAESSQMQDKYKTAVEVISKFESYIK